MLNNSIRLKESNESLMALKPQGERAGLWPSPETLNSHKRSREPRIQIRRRETDSYWERSDLYALHICLAFTLTFHPVALNIIITTTPLRVIKRLNHDSFWLSGRSPASINTRDIYQKMFSIRHIFCYSQWRLLHLSCDTEDCSNDAENTDLITEINYNLTDIHIVFTAFLIK